MDLSWNLIQTNYINKNLLTEYLLLGIIIKV